VSKKIKSFQPSIGLNQPTGRIVIEFEDGTYFDANSLSPDHYAAILATLQASPEAAVVKGPNGLIALGTKADAPGPG
jgi:hypothetical protein